MDGTGVGYLLVRSLAGFGLQLDSASALISGDSCSTSCPAAELGGASLVELDEVRPDSIVISAYAHDRYLEPDAPMVFLEKGHDA